jgi:hypothetical protein
MKRRTLRPSPRPVDCPHRLAVPADDYAICACGILAFVALDGFGRVIGPRSPELAWLPGYVDPSEVGPIECPCGLAYDVIWREA